MPDAIYNRTDRLLDRARSAAQLGLPIPVGTRFRFLKRVHARLGWFMTKRQIDHNGAVIAAIDSLAAEIRDHRRRVAEVLAEVEMSLRTEVLAARQHDEQRSVDLANLASRLGVLRAELDQLRSQVDSDSELGPGRGSAAGGTTGFIEAGEGHPVTSLRSVRNER